MENPKPKGDVVNVAIPSDVHYDLKLEAARQGTSVRTLTEKAIERYLLEQAAAPETPTRRGRLSAAQA